MSREVYLCQLGHITERDSDDEANYKTECWICGTPLHHCGTVEDDGTASFRKICQVPDMHVYKGYDYALNLYCTMFRPGVYSIEQAEKGKTFNYDTGESNS